MVATTPARPAAATASSGEVAFFVGELADAEVSLQPGGGHPISATSP